MGITMNVASGVSEKVEQQALAAVAVHPLHVEAKSWAHCVSDVFEEAKTFVERLRLTDEEKAAVQSALQDVKTVLVVSYWTAERKPEPMTGGGKHYAFFVHPQSFVVLHSAVGTWRS
ncbi:hypothetical protein [Roseateles sp. BYS96W]|uniref:Uncharacterized protein n=1 Tax=Pelomonas nitida TaxID=3299027 RepID=A0ABW7G3N8_9BURK